MRLFIYFDRDVHVVFVLPQLPWSAQKRQHHKKQMAQSSGLDTVTLICCPTSARLTDAGTRCWFARWFFYFFCARVHACLKVIRHVWADATEERHMPRRCACMKKRVSTPVYLGRIATAQSECAHFANICGSWPLSHGWNCIQLILSRLSDVNSNNTAEILPSEWRLFEKDRDVPSLTWSGFRPPSFSAIGESQSTAEDNDLRSITILPTLVWLHELSLSGINHN